jgi:hypothetical protein
MTIEGANQSLPVFSAWFGKSVVLLIEFRHCQVPVPCSIVSESTSDVRVRIESGVEMNLRKELILAVEEDVAGLDIPIDPGAPIN